MIFLTCRRAKTQGEMKVNYNLELDKLGREKYANKKTKGNRKRGAIAMGKRLG